MDGKINWTRRHILGAGGALSAVLMLNPLLVSAAEKAARKRQINWRNWGGNQHSQPGHIAAPRSEDEVVDLLRASSGSIRPGPALRSSHVSLGLPIIRPSPHPCSAS